MTVGFKTKSLKAVTVKHEILPRKLLKTFVYVLAHAHTYTHTHTPNTRVASMVFRRSYGNFILKYSKEVAQFPSTWRPPPAYESDTKLTTRELLSIRLVGEPP